MFTKRSIPLFVLVVLLLGACGSPDKGTDPGAGGDPDTPVSSTPGDDQSRPDPEPSITEPQPGQANVHPVGWDRAKVGNDDRTVTIKYWSGVEPCNVLDHINVEYKSDKIVISLFEGNTPSDEDTACIELAVEKTTIVELDEDVAGRKITDGAKA